eukprot:Nk52_evm26s212 gene=Nk52_evmTU26s212
MSRIHDTAEPVVIEEDILRKAIQDQGQDANPSAITGSGGGNNNSNSGNNSNNSNNTTGNNSNNANAGNASGGNAGGGDASKTGGAGSGPGVIGGYTSDIDYKEITNLRLDFKNILKIDNLWGFVNLTKLQLDNNIIEKIENISTLVHLKWLDLSFNNIEVIEGIDTLTQLTDLTLQNNRITKIENIETLKQLTVFSIGNNLIPNLEEVIYLRRLPQLRCVNLAGNPMCEEKEYNSFVLAYLPELKYLDFRLVDDSSRRLAEELHGEKVQELVMRTNEELRKAEEARMEEAELQRYSDAYVAGMQGDLFFESMFNEDAEMAKLNFLPQVKEVLTTYQEALSGICQELVNIATKFLDERVQEKVDFEVCLNHAKEVNVQKSVKVIEEFSRQKKGVLRSLSACKDQVMVEEELERMKQTIRDLHNTLLGLELELVEQLDEVTKEFERNMLDHNGLFVEQIQNQISQVRDQEGLYHEQLGELASGLMEKFTKSEIDMNELPDDFRALFTDKDTVGNIVNGSHDAHLSKIDAKEEEIQTRANKALEEMVENYKKEQLIRNRRRVIEICELTEYFMKEVCGEVTYNNDML